MIFKECQVHRLQGKNLNIESTTAEGGDTDSSELILKEKLTIFQRKCTFLDENFTVDRNCP